MIVPTEAQEQTALFEWITLAQRVRPELARKEAKHENSRFGGKTLWAACSDRKGNG